MSTHNYIYDPENGVSGHLSPGVRYQGTPPIGDRQIQLSDGNGSVVRVQRGNLIVPRQKQADRLQAAATDAAHELRMLAFAYLQSGHSAFAYSGWFFHLRNLMDFFEGKGHDRDEVNAQDYFPGAERDWHLARRAIQAPSAYKRYRTHANKLAAHLTYSRARMRKNSPRPHKQITEYIGELSALFLGRLTQERRRWFLRHLLPRA